MVGWESGSESELQQLELSEDLTIAPPDKDIFSNCDAALQKMIHYNTNVDLVNDNVYTKFG